MHRIDTPTAAVGGFFTNGDPVAGTPATRFDADWCNDLQENLMAVLTMAGIAPVKGTYTQLRDAIMGLGGGGSGGGAQWQPNPGNAPTQTEENGGLVYLFEPGQTSSVNLLLKVPANFIPGNQIFAMVGHYSPSATGTQLLTATSYLIRLNTDAITSTANSRTSTNTALNNTVANMYRNTVADITDATGKINSVTVNPGDMIKIVLSRGTDTDPADIRLVASATELRF